MLLHGFSLRTLRLGGSAFVFEPRRRKGREGVFGFFLIGEGSYQEKKTLLRAEHLEMVWQGLSTPDENQSVSWIGSNGSQPGNLPYLTCSCISLRCKPAEFLNREGAKSAKGVFGFFLIGEGSYQEKKTLLGAALLREFGFSWRTLRLEHDYINSQNSRIGDVMLRA